jgi:hypothetical protein
MALSGKSNSDGSYSRLRHRSITKSIEDRAKELMANL